MPTATKDRRKINATIRESARWISSALEMMAGIDRQEIVGVIEAARRLGTVTSAEQLDVTAGEALCFLRFHRIVTDSQEPGLAPGAAGESERGARNEEPGA